MFDRIKTAPAAALNRLAALDCHRFAYAGLAATYAAACLGIDKDLVNQTATVFYLALWARG